MKVDFEKCTGCGDCLEACLNEAISIVGGKVAIDTHTCLSCGACADACPEGAISEVGLPVPVKTAAIQPIKIHTAMSVPITSSESRLAWTRPILSFIGYEIVPRLADTLVAALERRLSPSSKAQEMIGSNTVLRINGGRRQMHRRRRGRNF